MKKRLSYTAGVIAATAMLGATAASADAVGFQATNGVAGGHAVTNAPVITSFQRFGLDLYHYVGCQTVTGSATVGVAPASVNPLSLSLAFSGSPGSPASSRCSFVEGQTTHWAEVSSPSPWTFTPTTTSAGTADTGGPITFTYGSGPSACVVTFPRIPAATMTAGNSGTAVRLAVSATGLSYSSTGCAIVGLPATGTAASYSGAFSIADTNLVP